jgi:hypothetical protein
VTVATDISGRWRIPTDGRSHIRNAIVLAVRVATWLRDEEAKTVIAVNGIRKLIHFRHLKTDPPPAGF